MRGFSELERSDIDEKQGRMIWAGESVPARSAPNPLVPGSITTLSDGVEELTVPLVVERFANGAHVRLVLSQRSDSPDPAKAITTQQHGARRRKGRGNCGGRGERGG